MKTILSFTLSLITVSALAQPKLVFDDPNPESARVTTYKVWDVTGSGAFGGARTLSFEIPAPPKSGSATSVVSAQLPVSLAGKTITVSALAASGLESVDATPTLPLPPLPAPPTGLVITLDRATSRFVFSWNDPNAAVAAITRYRVVQMVNGQWEDAGDVTAKSYLIPTGSPATRWAVKSVNLWGPSPQALSIEAPVGPVPVTGIRAIAQ